MTIFHISCWSFMLPLAWTVTLACIVTIFLTLIALYAWYREELGILSWCLCLWNFLPFPFPFLAWVMKAWFSSTWEPWSLCLAAILVSSWVQTSHYLIKFGNLVWPLMFWMKDSQYGRTLIRLVMTSSFSSRLSPLYLILSCSSVILMKYEAMFSDLVIFIFDSLFLNVRVTLILLRSNNFFKVLNIFQAVIFSEICGTKWSLTESTRILLVFASPFLH